jgi:dTDP-4-dehydrorhamnose reductase
VRWLITGSGGQLGQCLTSAVQARPGEVLAGALNHSEFDIARPGALAELLKDGRIGRPDILVNAAAFTAVDRCESEEALALRINAEGPGWLAEDCREAGINCIHVSTDYVFSGTARDPYLETAAVAPRTAYGRTKAEGERRVLEALPGAVVVRTSWVFGPGRNFVGAILRQARRRAQGLESGPLRVVSDQYGSPTYAADLAEGILDLGSLAFAPPDADRGNVPGARSGGTNEGEESGMRGIFHLSNRGKTNWLEFARSILELTGYGDLALEPLATADLELPAVRPAWSVLGCERAGGLGIGLRPWREALAGYLNSAAGVALRQESV